MNGTATLTCENLNREIHSETFKLEGDHDFLGAESSAKFLLSPDPFFVDLVKTRNNKCSDAYLQIGEYQKINRSKAKLVKVNSFDVFYNDYGDYDIINKTYDNIVDFTHYVCMRCNVTIKIYSSNHKTVDKDESHKFISGSTTYDPFEKEIFISNPDIVSEIFSFVRSGYPSGFNYAELCRKTREKFHLGINCEEVVNSVSIGSPPFTYGKIVGNPPIN